MVAEMFYTLSDMFGLLLLGAWRALPLVLIVLFTDLLLRRRLAAKYHCVLWSLVGLRMIIPFSLEAPFSMHGHFDRYGEQFLERCFKESEPQSEVAADDLTPPPPQEPKSIEPLADFLVTSSPETVDARSGTMEVAQNGSLDRNAIAFLRLLDWEEVIAIFVLLIWISVVFILLTRNGIAYAFFARRISRSKNTIHESTAGIVSNLCKVIGVRRCPSIKEIDGLDVPAVFGVFRPAICMPRESNLTEVELRSVLAHELGHIKRRDTILISVAMILRSICWINPFAWIVVSRLRSWMEVAADEVAIGAIKETTAAEYGRLLVRFASIDPSTRTSSALGLLFASQSKRLRLRIEQLDQSTKQRTWLNAILAFSIVTLLAFTGLTDANTVALNEISPEQSEYFKSLVKEGGYHPSVPHSPSPGDLIEEFDFDLKVAIAKLEERYPGIRAEDFLLSLTQFPKPIPDSRAVIEEGIMKIRLPRNVGKTVQGQLKAIERNGLGQITIETRLIDAETELFDHIDWSNQAVVIEDRIRKRAKKLSDDENSTFERYVESGYESGYAWGNFAPRSASPALAAVIDEAQLYTLLGRCNNRQRADYIQAPKVTMFSGQYATICDAAFRPFVTGIEPIRGELTTANRPVIDVLPDGCKMDIQADPNDQGGFSFKFILSQSHLTKTDGEFGLTFRQGTDRETGVTLNNPHVEQSSHECQVDLAPGDTLIVAVPSDQPIKKNGKPRARFYAITPRGIEDDMSPWMPK